MKLVYEHYETDGFTYGNTITVCFEYISKENFVYEVLEKIKEARKNSESGMFSIEICDSTLNLDDHIDPDRTVEGNVENNIFTLDEWFEKNKIELEIKL